MSKRTAAVFVVVILSIILRTAPSPAVAQTPAPTPTPPTEPLYHCLDRWAPDYQPDRRIAPPTGVRASMILEEEVVRITWSDNADNETCYGVVKTFPEDVSPHPFGRSVPLLGAQANTTLAVDTRWSRVLRGQPGFPVPGRYCYQVFTGNAAGISALSPTACIDVPDSFAAGTTSLSSPPKSHPHNRGGGRWGDATGFVAILAASASAGGLWLLTSRARQ